MIDTDVNLLLFPNYTQKVGIASVFGSECTPGRASGYTRVSSYSDWINEEVRKHASKQEGEREDGEKGQ